jgi:hypothetical protein
MLPPGICVCQWHSPAARILVGLLNTGKEVPPPPAPENEDDHEPGCPASKLAAGMGLRPASPPPLLPALAPESVPPSDLCAADSTVGANLQYTTHQPPDSSLYLTVCALLI